MKARLARYITRSARAAAHPLPPRTPEDTLPTRSSTLGLALAAAALAAVGCDRLPDAVIVPEFEISYSFESGLEGWTASAADFGAGSWSADATTERATAGTRALRLSLVNPGGTGRVWLTREIEATPGKSYTADVTFDLATADHGVGDAWKLIVGARAAPPGTAAELDFQGDTSSGQATGTGVVWAPKHFVLPATPDEKGKLYFTLGIWGTTGAARTYWIDNVKVSLTRTN